jgi:predicted dinucleotide-binding enzyme
MEVGIIGAGRLGQAMARTALRAGRSVVIANSRGAESLTSVVSALGEGVSAGTVGEAAAAGIVVVAVPWDRVPEAAQGLNWNSQVVIDATNDWAADDLDGRTSSEIVAGLVAGLVAGARVVKAANTLSAEVLESDPQEAGGRRVIFISADDADAKAEVVTLFQDAGFAAIDLGDLATGGAMQQIHHPLAGVNLIEEEGSTKAPQIAESFVLGGGNCPLARVHDPPGRPHLRQTGPAALSRCLSRRSRAWSRSTTFLLPI